MRSRRGPPGNSTACSGKSGSCTMSIGPVDVWTCGRVDVSVRGPPSDVYTSTRLLVIRTLPQSREQLLVDAAETAVRHDQHVIPGSRRLDKRRDETVAIRRNLRARSERRDAFRHIPLNARPLVHEDLIGARERSRERFPVRAEFHRVRARLEYRDQASAADTATQALDRRRDSGRMMRKIVEHAHPIHDAPQLEPATNASERLQGARTGSDRNARMSRSEQCG